MHDAKSTWVDLETTCLDHKSENAFILEFAAVAVNPQLEVYSSMELLIWPEKNGKKLTKDQIIEALLEGNTYEMHTESGLIDDLFHSNETVSVIEAAEQFLEFVEHNELEDTYLGGSGPHFDKFWIFEHMGQPGRDALSYISHRHIDINSIREYMKYRGVEVPKYDYQSSLGNPHRAHSDILNSLEIFKNLLTLDIQ